MKDPKDSPYGARPKYEIGDEVKVWPVYGRPSGTVRQVVDPTTFPIKYSVEYRYEDGRYFTEEFESTDLTLTKKYKQWGHSKCECGSTTLRHSSWCPEFKE